MTWALTGLVVLFLLIILTHRRVIALERRLGRAEACSLESQAQVMLLTEKLAPQLLAPQLLAKSSADDSPEKKLMPLYPSKDLNPYNKTCRLCGAKGSTVKATFCAGCENTTHRFPYSHLHVNCSRCLAAVINSGIETRKELE